MISYGITVGATFGAALTLITWRNSKLLRRLRLAPVATGAVVGARVVVSLAVAVFQLVLLLGVSMLLGLRLSGAWYMAVPLTIAGTLAFLAIGLLVGSIAKTAEGGSGLANLITLPMGFLSGAFIPLVAAPGWLIVISKIMPMGYLVSGLSDVLVRGEGPSAALLPIAILLAFAAVLTADRDPAVPLGRGLTPGRLRSRRRPCAAWSAAPTAGSAHRVPGRRSRSRSSARSGWRRRAACARWGSA